MARPLDASKWWLVPVPPNGRRGSNPTWRRDGRIKRTWLAWLDDVKALYGELIDRGAIIDYELHLKPYSVLEFGIQDLEGHDIAFGQIVR